MGNTRVFLTVLAIYVLQTGCAKIIYVSPSAAGNGSGEDWKNACATISKALDIAAHEVDEEIWVAAGVYRETIRMKQKTKIFGGFDGTETDRDQRDWVANLTVIDGSGGENSAVSAVNLHELDESGYTAELNGFTIQGSQHGGIDCLNSSPDIVYCTIVNNSAPQGGGIHIANSSPTIGHCVIASNSADAGGGVYCENSLPRFLKTVFHSNRSASGGVLYCTGESVPVLINCTLADNEGDGIECLSGSYAEWLNCIAWNTGLPITGEGAELSTVEYSCVAGGWPDLGNIGLDPLFVDGGAGDYRLTEDSPCIDAGIPAEAWNDSSRPPARGTARNDMGAFGGPDNLESPILFYQSGALYVRVDAAAGGDGLSWDTALDSIGTALAAIDQGVIYVAAGRYRESIVLKPDVAVYGGFAGSESARGERDWTANETVIDAAGKTEPAVTGADRSILDGFTVTGGNQPRIQCDRTSPTVMHCVIASGGTESDGSGVYCDRSSPLIQDCDIVDNVVNGTGGGVSCNGRGTPRFVNCRIMRNSAHRGGGVYSLGGTSPVFINCIISMNEATDKEDENAGSGFEFVLEPPTLIHCVVWGNKGLGISFNDYKVKIVNSILWNNPGDEIACYDDNDENAIVSFSCVEGGWPGEGNIDADPLFIDPENGDFRLQDGSPCIDAGLASAAPEFDIGGLERPGIDGRVDMGAHESPPAYGGKVSAWNWSVHE